ncbi:hypothetical protein Tco_0983468 [Tanacetum coccineum]
MDTTMKILEWNIKAPLEIIYEAYKGEEEEDEVNNDNNMVSNDKEIIGCERYLSLSLYYPESDNSREWTRIRLFASGPGLRTRQYMEKTCMFVTMCTTMRMYLEV